MRGTVYFTRSLIVQLVSITNPHDGNVYNHETLVALTVSHVNVDLVSVL